MKMILIVITLMLGLTGFGQKNKYRDYKDDIPLKKEYKKQKKKYSPFVAGIGNYVLPSSGYFYVGEPVRGACVLGSEVAAMGLMAIGGNESFNNGVFIHPMVSVGAISFAIIWIWSIFDVVKVAKIKNLANQNNKVTIKLNSDLNFISQDYTNNSAVYGLKLSIGF
ncbi:MAG: hypothetical protein P8H43_04895 [Crocinitomicaceae bacterium]|jgi:hypothetical protein|nr:hypothetical protein [Flavobacteriaceae bacterium]MDG1741893.1 hypothetical protein [Crocinitomicaceae bacterium]